MGKNKRKNRDRERRGGSKTLPHDQKQTGCTVDGGEGSASQHKHDDLNSAQNNKGVHQEHEAVASSSGSQVGTWMKRSGESECKELTADGSIGTGFEMSDIYNCTEYRVILKEMVETHPQRDDYIAKFEEHRVAHAVRCDWMCEGPSSKQKCDIQFSDVKSSTDNQPEGLSAEQLSQCVTGKGNWDDEENEVAAAAAEDRSSVGDDCQAAGGGHDWWKGQAEAEDAEDAGWNNDQQYGSKRRSEDSHNRERRDSQKGRQDRVNWRTEDRSAGDRGGRGHSMKYEDKGCKIVKEVYGDLFTAPKEWSLAHCVATDMRMGSGIAVSFRQDFKSVAKLLEQGARVGQIAVLEHEGRYIYYLVTKRYSNEKPYFEDLVSSLKEMRDHCAEHGVKHLAMPRIGCGLDRLEWRDVKPKIEEIFSGLDISITVYNFNQRWGTRARSRSNSTGPPHSLCRKNLPKKERQKKSEQLQKGNQNIKKGKKKKSKNR